MKLTDFDSGPFLLHHTRTESPVEEEFPLHAHDSYELYCFLEGQGYYTVEGHDYLLTHGCLLLMRDGETHKLHISAHKPYERIALHFPPDLLSGTVLEGLLAPFHDRPLGQRNMVPFCPAQRRAIELLLRMSDARDDEHLNVATLHYAYLPAVLAEINQALLEGDSDHPTDRKQDTLISEIIEFINRDPASVADVDMLEKVFGYSRSYLNRVFRRSTGVSIWDYVILKRLTLARSAIRNGSAAAAAAKEAGFSDYSSFYRQYKKRFGLTPEEEKRTAAH